MSTRIYDGVQLKGTDSSYGLLQFRQMARKGLRPVLTYEAGKQFYRGLVALALHLKGVKLFDLEYGYLHLEEFRRPVQKEAYLRVMKQFIRDQLAKQMAQNNATSTLDGFVPDMDFSINLAVFPLKHKTLAIPFTYNHTLLKTFMSLPGVEEYGYWDSTDKPDDVTDEQWRARNQDWEEALPGVGVPRWHGLCFDILNNDDVTFTDQELSEETKEEVRNKVISEALELYRFEVPEESLPLVRKRMEKAVLAQLADSEN